MNFFLPKYIATRVYHNANAIKSVIVNEVEKEFIELENDSALLWKSILRHEDKFDLTIISNDINKPENEVKLFLDELLNIKLISEIDNKSSINQDFNTFKKNIASGLRYSNGGYVEPAPGGSNLEAEIELMDWASDNGYLYSAGWELTYRCNERCVHCFNPGASHVEGDKSFRKVEELDTQKIIQTLSDMKQLGVFRLLLTGGEIFLRKDLFEILEHVRKERFSFTIFTNGTLIKENQIKKLKDYYPHRVELSIYSHIPEKHDKITRLKNSFAQTMNTVSLLMKNDIEILLKMIVMKDTVDDVKGFEDMCKKMDIFCTVDYNMSAGVDGNSYPIENLLPEPKNLILQSLNSTSPLYVGTIDKPNNYDFKKSFGTYVCGAGRTTMNISAEGNISPCNSLPLEYGNLKKNKLSEVWINSDIGKKISEKQRVYSKERSDNADPSERLSSWQAVKRGMYEVCGTFDRCNWCQKCPGMAYLETGSELKPSTTNCRNSAARMIAYEMLKKFKNADEVRKNIDLEQLKKKYKNELALWEPLKNIELNKDTNHQNIILNRTKPSALKQLLEKEGLL